VVNGEISKQEIKIDRTNEDTAVDTAKEIDTQNEKLIKEDTVGEIEKEGTNEVKDIQMEDSVKGIESKETPKEDTAVDTAKEEEIDPVLLIDSKLTKEEREKMLIERCRKKQRLNISLKDVGKSRLEYFDISTIVDAVEKHKGCLNPTAPEEEKKFLHQYFLEILRIPMVISTIKVLPIRLNLKGTGVPYTWNKK